MIDLGASLILAHAGQMHWYDYLLYLMPLILIGIATAIGVINERRGKRGDAPADEERRGGK